MRKVRHDAIGHLQIDRHGGSAQLGMRGGRRVRRLQASDAGDVAGETKNFRVVDVVDHEFPPDGAYQASLVAEVTFIRAPPELYNERIRPRARRGLMPGRCQAASGGTDASSHETRERLEPFNSPLRDRGYGSRLDMDAIIRNFPHRPEPQAKSADTSAFLDRPVTDRPSREEAEAAVRTLLRWAGDDPDREGLRDTPARVVKAYQELFSGYDRCPADELGRTFEEVA